ncbi:hypothetical protein OQA88_289 [Cercophora sp. LCS_1]
MAATPDLSHLTTSSQIFSANHTLPQIRTIHKTLLAQLDDTAVRLRTQVGGSYRDLLGTADSIVAMRADMDAVQSTLARMGSRCGRTVVNQKVGGLAHFVQDRESGGEDSRRARTRLLDGVVLCLGSVLREKKSDKRGERLLLAARLWVLGRLVAKSLGESRGEGLEGLRRRLVRGVEGVLRSGRDEDVVGALGAYALATSSGGKDVLRHFLRVRGMAMGMAFEGEERRGGQEVVRCLGLFTKTLRDVQGLVPARLREALAALKRDPLLADQGLRGLEELRLDVYKRWCGDEIQYYKPFIRHDDLDVRQAAEMLSSWAEEGSKVLLKGLKKTLEGMNEFKAIVELRTSVLKLWIQEGGKAKGVDPSILLGQLRGAINEHLLEVLEAKVAKLRLVGSEVSAALDAWREGTTDQHPSLWDVESFDTDLSNGAAQFTQDVVARLYGRNDAASKAVTCFQSWYHVIDDVATVVDQLRRQRWENDADEIEDEETIENRQKLLAKEDPQKLSDHLNISLVKAFKNLDDHLGLLWKSHQDGPNKGHIAMYFVRVLRDIRVRLPEGLGKVKDFGLDAVPSLHQTLTTAVAESPLQELATVALARKVVAGRSLWEGSPELPTSPSPGIFKFLRNLLVSMGDSGADLWSPAAVAVLKKHLREQVCQIWKEAVEKADTAIKEQYTAQSESEAEDEESEDAGSKNPSAGGDTLAQQRRDLFTQWLFDIFYLEFFLESSPPNTKGEFDNIKAIIRKGASLGGATAEEKLAKTSREYFKRTSLLFGLLS